MKQLVWKFGNSLAAVLLAALAIQPSATRAQETTASIHGKATNPIGSPLNGGEVRLTTDRTSAAKDRKYTYTFPVDATGSYKGTGIKPDNYVAILFQQDHSLDFNDSVQLKAGDDKLVDFDMSRKEYLDKMSPEEKKALEEYRKKNAEVTNANTKISNLNTLLTQARADNKAGNYDAAITSMKQATEAKPDEGILWVTLGDAQLGAADVAAKAGKAAGKPATDPEIAAKYTDAVASYKKAIDLNAASKKPNPETAAAADNQLGQAYGKIGDVKDASAAYDAAAAALPANAGMYYSNESVTFYNAGKMDEAAAAADKATAADPKRAIAFYIKGQALIPKASVDPKTQKITAPPGCVEAYQQYLELEPTGAHAQEVKDILTGIGATVKSSYKAGKK